MLLFNQEWYYRFKVCSWGVLYSMFNLLHTKYSHVVCMYVPYGVCTCAIKRAETTIHAQLVLQ